MTRRLSMEWPDPAPFKDRDGAPIRILAVSDHMDNTLLDQRNRQAIGRIDMILGCGDLECDDLAFIADGFNAPLVYVHGNHDDPERWAAAKSFCPDAINSTSVRHECGISIAGLSWPGPRGRRAARSERKAWNQALRLATRRLGRPEPVIVISHVPPLGVGDMPTNGYHRGFRGYLWLLRRLGPQLWLHGHTPLAAAAEWKLRRGPTTLVNVTGAVVIELLPPGSAAAPPTTPAATPAEGSR
jgi:Icc-related predicted phosphoesterase